MAPIDSSTPSQKTVCVVGTGVLGLLALKNLREQGHNAVALERNEWIAGTWHVSTRNVSQTSAVELTTANTSKQVSSFTDYPYPDDYPNHPTAKQLQDYLEGYAKHFDLYPHIQYHSEVVKIRRDNTAGRWNVHVKDTRTGNEQVRSFDKVVVATGILNTPNMPEVPGIDKFKGDVAHSRDFKDPSKYKGKNVIVVGIGATGADLLTFLRRADAKNVYLSHRGQFFLLPRMLNGKAFDHSMNRRAVAVIRCLSTYAPHLCIALMGKMLVTARKSAWPFLSQHSAFSSPRALGDILHRVPVFADNLAEMLRDGEVQSVQGIREISGPKAVTLTDGTVLDDIDAIVFATGYHFDFSIVDGPGNPVDPAYAPDHYKRIQATQGYDPHNPFARLYRGFISEKYPDSLAFLGYVIIMKPPFVLYDLVTMALSSFWTDKTPMPTAQQMRKDIDIQYDFCVRNLKNGPMPHLGMRMISDPTYNWLVDISGTGLNEKLGWSSEGWSFWWNHRKLYKKIMDGVASPAVYRLFDLGRGRKPWAGAEEQIFKTDEEVNKAAEVWKKEQALKQS